MEQKQRRTEPDGARTDYPVCTCYATGEPFKAVEPFMFVSRSEYCLYESSIQLLDAD
jgi:hypothetical protein